MARAAIIICTYNKKEYVLKCLASLFEQTWQDFDIIVVDNASSDGTSEAVMDAYGSKVTLRRTDENLGGTGGFNTGMEQALSGDYEYLALLDSDVVLDRECLGRMVALLGEEKNIGILGSKILKMDLPDIIQEFGPMLNMENVSFEVRDRGEKEDIPLPDVKDCDYVPACALMVRRSVADQIGMMPDGNFIYYDDIEWCMRCRQAGFRVAVSNLAKVWHKGGAGIDKTTFSVYYINRNKTDFFMRFLPVGDDAGIEELKRTVKRQGEIILRDMYQGLYVCKRTGMKSVYKTRMEAFLDALEGHRGKTEDYKIIAREILSSPFVERFAEVSRVALHMNGCWENTREVVFALQNLGRSQRREIEIVLVNAEKMEREKLLGIQILPDLPDGFEGLALDVCAHIYSLDNPDPGKKYIDGWKNSLMTEEDFRAHKKFKEEYEIFRSLFENRLLAAMCKEHGLDVREL